jgi:hypothetical protein
MYLYDSTNLLSYNCISIVKDVQLITLKLNLKRLIVLLRQIFVEVVYVSIKHKWILIQII